MKIKQRGTTVIEVLGAFAVGSLMLLGLTTMIDTSMEDTKGQQAALHQARIADAARKYISANYKALKDIVHEPHLVTTISINDLISQNFLTAGFALVNAYDQATCILVRQPVQGSGKLEALVVTSGGQAIEDANIRVVAAHSGEGGGYIAAAAPTTAQGASWSVSTVDYQGVSCDGAGAAVLAGTAADAGHLVSNLFYDGPGFTDFLYRYAVDGRPDLNKMSTPLRFNEDAANIVEGSACGTHAAIASDHLRNLLRCGSNGLWTQMTPWKNPVANYAALGSLPADQKTAGDVRMILDKKRAFMYDGTDWVALAVDQNGNLAVENNLTVGKDVNASWVYGQWGVSGAQLFLESQWAAGHECRVPVMTEQGLEYWWDSGTFVRDWRGLTLSCLQYTAALAADYPWIPAPSTGYAWTYQNGKFEP